MNKLLYIILEKVISTLIGPLNYERLKVWVREAETTGLAGDMKRAMVLESAMSIRQTIGLALLNLAIEVAVNVFRNKYLVKT